MAVARLIGGSPDGTGAPHVVGVQTESGEEVLGELVVDMGGRRSALTSWLADLGAAPIAEERRRTAASCTSAGTLFRPTAPLRR